MGSPSLGRNGLKSSERAQENLPNRQTQSAQEDALLTQQSNEIVRKLALRKISNKMMMVVANGATVSGGGITTGYRGRSFTRWRVAEAANHKRGA